MSPERIDRLLEFIHDERFAHIRSLAAREPLPWERFVGQEMPLGYSPEEVWTVLTALRRQTAIVLPFKAYVWDVADAWYTPTESMSIQLRELESRTCSGSALDRATAERTSRYFLIQPMVEEAVAAAWRDGLDVNYETVREVLRKERPPATPEERVMFNCHEVVFDMERYASRRITRGLIEELYERVIDGVESLKATSRPRLTEIIDSGYSDPDAVLGLICKMANGETIDPMMHPIINALSMACMFWDFRPLPQWSAIVELLVRRIYLVRAGYPVLKYLPFSKASLAWEQGRIHVPEVLCTFAQANPDCGEGRDWTFHFAVNLQLMIAELNSLERTVSTVQERDEHLQELLSHDPAINHRQRAILTQALRLPDAELRIEPHRKLYDVAYATARADFLALVDLGFLLKEQRNKTFVFRARPDLNALIEAHEVNGAVGGKRR